MLLSKYKLKLQSLCARHSSHLENQLIPRRKTTVVAFRCDDDDNNHFHDKFFLTGIMRENKKIKTTNLQSKISLSLSLHSRSFDEKKKYVSLTYLMMHEKKREFKYLFKVTDRLKI